MTTKAIIELLFPYRKKAEEMTNDSLIDPIIHDVNEAIEASKITEQEYLVGYSYSPNMVCLYSKHSDGDCTIHRAAVGGEIVALHDLQFLAEVEFRNAYDLYRAKLELNLDTLDYEKVKRIFDLTLQTPPMITWGKR
jgi:hypothetical protein